VDTTKASAAEANANDTLTIVSNSSSNTADDVTHLTAGQFPCLSLIYERMNESGFLVSRQRGLVDLSRSDLNLT